MTPDLPFGRFATGLIGVKDAGYYTATHIVAV